MTKHCITFAPFLKHINGHCKDYHLSLNAVFKSRGWKVATFVQELTEASSLPSHWFKNLYEPSKWSKNSVFAKAFPFIVNQKAVRLTQTSYLKALQSYFSQFPHDEFTLFFETFNTFHLFVLRKILPFLPHEKISIALLYRYDQKQLFFKGRFDKKILSQMEKKLGRAGLTLFADTDALVNDLSAFFKREVYLLPIPHTEGMKALKIKSESNDKKLTFWWPGPPRSPKGLSFIQQLSKNEDLQEGKWVLKLSEHTPGLSQQPSKGLVKISNFLSRENYLKHFEDTDVILMPYSKWNYECSSSGIFVEAICAGIVPAVSDGLWISSELKRFGLSSLIFDFENPNVLKQIEKAAKDPHVLSQLSNMKNHYQQYHNESSLRDEIFKSLSQH